MGESLLVGHLSVDKKETIDYDVSAAAPQQPDLVLHTTMGGIGVRARGLGGLQPPDSGKTIIFQAKANFFGQKPAAKNEKSIFCIY